MNINKEIYEEIHEISPDVASLIKSDNKSVNKDKIPVNYFDTLEKHVMSQAFIDKQMLISSEVDFYPEKDYFASLEDRILNIIKKERNEIGGKVQRIYSKSVFKYAAILLILTGSVFVFKNQFIIHDTEGEVFDEAYIEYLKRNIDDVDINMLIQTDIATEDVLKEIPEYPALKHDDILLEKEY